MNETETEKRIRVEKISAEFNEKMDWANSLTKDRIDFLCDGGWYNNAIRGYLIKAAKYAEMDDKQISELLEGLDVAFDNCDKRDAEKTYANY